MSGYTLSDDGQCMMGKGHGKRRKWLCVEDSENDSVHVDSTRWQGDAVAVKKVSVCWVVRFEISMSPEKSLSIVTVFHPAAYARGRPYGCRLARVTSFPVS